MQGNMLSKANETLIQEYLEIATVTDDMDRFSKLLTDDCVWVMMPLSRRSLRDPDTRGVHYPSYHAGLRATRNQLLAHPGRSPPGARGGRTRHDGGAAGHATITRCLLLEKAGALVFALLLIAVLFALGLVAGEHTPPATTRRCAA